MMPYVQKKVYEDMKNIVTDSVDNYKDSLDSYKKWLEQPEPHVTDHLNEEEMREEIINETVTKIMIVINEAL
jgi:hypothetical protein